MSGGRPSATRPVAPVALGRAVRMRAADACAEALREAILNGSFTPGSQLPSEKELGISFGVSRNTVREALEAVELAGLIVRRQGLGTFVATEPVIKDLNINAGITTMLAAAGIGSHTGKLSIVPGRSSADEAAALGIAPGADVTRVERVRQVNKTPVVTSTDTVPAAVLGEDIIRDELAATASLYELLRKHGIRVVRGTAHLRPANATTALARRLQVQPGHALMLIEQTDYDRADVPILFSVEYHLPDFFVFQVQRTGPYG
jgi:GntR family transcriptional regulator